MKSRTKYILLTLLCFTGLFACKTPYTPTPISTITNYLVVEGMINITDSTYINLSRTVNISAKTTVKPELKATVTIESSQGSSYPLKELGNGVYAVAPLGLSTANRYRVRIKTATGSTYASDFTDAKISPPIDSITWKAKNTALEIYANTHDPNKATRYYRWSFTDEWVFHPNYESIIISDGLNVRLRTPAEQIWTCYTGSVSTAISLGTSAQLSQDIITGSVVNSIAPDAERLSIEYSILVKQYALTKDAYDYWTLLKKNTEQLGGVFDSQPSASIGNIHNINAPNEPVIGYISAGTFTSQRIFIFKNQLPKWTVTPFYALLPNCGIDSLNCCVTGTPPPLPPTTNQFVNKLSTNFTGGTPLTPINTVFPNLTGTITNSTPITAADITCVDCTIRGSKARPAYWQ